MAGFDEVWQRIMTLRGETFYQKTGSPSPMPSQATVSSQALPIASCHVHTSPGPLRGHRWTGLASFRTCRGRLTFLLS